MGQFLRSIFGTIIVTFWWTIRGQFLEWFGRQFKAGRFFGQFLGQFWGQLWGQLWGQQKMFVHGELIFKHLYIPALKGQLNRVIRVIEVKKVQSFPADNGADGIFFATSRKTCFFILKITKTNSRGQIWVNFGQKCAQWCELIFEGAFSFSYSYIFTFFLTRIKQWKNIP